MELQKGNALIRHYCHVQPETLNDEIWAELLDEAIWLDYHKQKQLADLLSALLGVK
jgi:hypothetical protein